MDLKEGDLVVFKGNSRPRVLVRLTAVSDTWMVGNTFHWGQMTFVGSGTLHPRDIIDNVWTAMNNEANMFRTLPKPGPCLHNGAVA